MLVIRVFLFVLLHGMWISFIGKMIMIVYGIDSNSSNLVKIGIQSVALAVKVITI